MALAGGAVAQKRSPCQTSLFQQGSWGVICLMRASPGSNHASVPCSHIWMWNKRTKQDLRAPGIACSVGEGVLYAWRILITQSWAHDKWPGVFAESIKAYSTACSGLCPTSSGAPGWGWPPHRFLLASSEPDTSSALVNDCGIDQNSWAAWFSSAWSSRIQEPWVLLPALSLIHSGQVSSLGLSFLILRFRNMNLTSGPLQFCRKMLLYHSGPSHSNHLPWLVFRLSFRFWRRGTVWANMRGTFRSLPLDTWSNRLIGIRSLPPPSSANSDWIFFSPSSSLSCFSTLKGNFKSGRSQKSRHWAQLVRGRIPPWNFKWTGLCHFLRNFLELCFVGFLLLLLLFLSEMLYLNRNMKNSL